jgi:hypothetical protein
MAEEIRRRPDVAVGSLYRDIVKSNIAGTMKNDKA